MLDAKTKPQFLKEMWKERWSWLFLLPAYLLFFMFTFRSILFTIYFSFFEWSGVANPSDFIGFENFISVASDPFFWNAFRNSFVFMFFVSIGQLSIGLAFALALNTRFKGVVVFRTLLFLPVITTTSIIGLVMPLIFSPIYGPVNQLLIGLGILERPLDWLGSPDRAMLTVILIAIWKWTGTYMIYWLAGLQSIPLELYEAARLDGANGPQQLVFITLPMMKTIALVIILFCVVGNLKPFDLIKTMTNGGPYFKTDVVMTYIYRYAFSAEAGIPRLGFASAAGLFYGVVLILFTAFQVWVGRITKREKSTGSLASKGGL